MLFLLLAALIGVFSLGPSPGERTVNYLEAFLPIKPIANNRESLQLLFVAAGSATLASTVESLWSILLVSVLAVALHAFRAQLYRLAELFASSPLASSLSPRSALRILTQPKRSTRASANATQAADAADEE